MSDDVPAAEGSIEQVVEYLVHTQVVLNNLYKYTALQMRFPVNAVALVDGTPQTLSLKEFLERFLEFRCEVVRRRARQVSLHAVFCCTQQASRLHRVNWQSPQHSSKTPRESHSHYILS